MVEFLDEMSAWHAPLYQDGVGRLYALRIDPEAATYVGRVPRFVDADLKGACASVDSTTLLFDAVRFAPIEPRQYYLDEELPAKRTRHCRHQAMRMDRLSRGLAYVGNEYVHLCMTVPAGARLADLVVQHKETRDLLEALAARSVFFC